MTPIETSCPHSELMPDGRNCAAQAGEECRWVDPVSIELIPRPGQYHAERVASAAGSFSDAAAAPISVKDLDAVVDQLAID